MAGLRLRVSAHRHSVLACKRARVSILVYT